MYTQNLSLTHTNLRIRIRTIPYTYTHAKCQMEVATMSKKASTWKPVRRQKWQKLRWRPKWYKSTFPNKILYTYTTALTNISTIILITTQHKLKLRFCLHYIYFSYHNISLRKVFDITYINRLSIYATKITMKIIFRFPLIISFSAQYLAYFSSDLWFVKFEQLN